MRRLRTILLLTSIALLFAGLTVRGADQNRADQNRADQNRAREEATATQTARSAAQFLPEKLAGVKATGEIQQFGRENLTALVGEKATAYQEYLVTEASLRQYGQARVEVFQTENDFSAFGLFTYVKGGRSQAGESDETVFWKENFFVRVTVPGPSPLKTTLARSISESLAKSKHAVKTPPLIESLPRQGVIASSERYFLGPESLNDYVERGRDMFGFAGDAEAAMAEYEQPGAERPRMRLLIVEYHTPQFAYDAHARIDTYLGTLTEEERSRILVKRQGNYIVEATNFDDREFAQGLIDSVQYPYTVKLLDPLAPMNDPFAAQKAARMLMSTFGIIGLTLLTVLFLGSTFGAAIFLKRRKQQQEMFTDAGGMLRLDLDPFEAVILGLPPKRTQEE